MFALESAEAYWLWVAAGSYLRSQEELLKLAEVRDKQLKDLVAAGKNKAIDLTFNELLIPRAKSEDDRNQAKIPRVRCEAIFLFAR